MKKLEHHMSAQRDLRVYALLLIGLIFAVAGFATDPAKNCDERGRDCAPSLVYVARVVGVLAVVGGLFQIARNRRWGSRLDVAKRRLYWWDSSVASGESSFALDDVATVNVQRQGEDHDRICFYGKDGKRIRFPKEQALPYDPVEWSKDLRRLFPHIEITVGSKVVTPD